MADYLKTEALKDIADAFESTTKVLVNHSKRLEVLEKDVDYAIQLALRGGRVVAKKNNRRMIFVAVGIGMYVGYKLAENDLNARKKEWQEALKDKQPAHTTPKSDKPTENGKDEPQS